MRAEQPNATIPSQLTPHRGTFYDYRYHTYLITLSWREMKRGGRKQLKNRRKQPSKKFLPSPPRTAPREMSWLYIHCTSLPTLSLENSIFCTSLTTIKVSCPVRLSYSCGSCSDIWLLRKDKKSTACWLKKSLIKVPYGKFFFFFAGFLRYLYVIFKNGREGIGNLK
jgi:hypothetical protein